MCGCHSLDKLRLTYLLGKGGDEWEGMDWKDGLGGRAYRRRKGGQQGREGELNQLSIDT